jgi:hypothetical protein
MKRMDNSIHQICVNCGEANYYIVEMQLHNDSRITLGTDSFMG